MAHYRGVDVLGLERSGTAGSPPTERGALLVGEAGEPRHVPARLDDEVAEVDAAVGPRRVGEHVPDDHQVVPTDHAVAGALLVADVAAHTVQGKPSALSRARGYRPVMDADILEYYERGGEDTRLDDSVELLRTKVLLHRYLPPAAEILDVGGASGVYATWLAEQGHRVRLVDPVPRHVESARAKGIEAVTGDARALAEPDASRDAVLLLGPLYHLLDRTDRIQALAEAGRVSRDLVIAAAISRWSPMFEGMLRGFIDSPGFLPMLHEDLDTGTRRGTQNVPYGFTTCYFHRPADLAAEVADAGLTLVDLLPVEGMAYWIPDLAERLSDPDKRAVVLELLEKTEREPAIIGATAHLLAVARKSA